MSLHGLLVLDKPPGLTSRDAVDRAAKWFPRKTRIGHAGTLDPLATGVLVLAVGQATRLIEYVQAMPKVYRTRIHLGATSDTDDADGTVTPNRPASMAGGLTSWPAGATRLFSPREGSGSTGSTSASTGGRTWNWTFSAGRGRTSGRSPATWARRSGSAGT
jgi:TruB family pseudouridylate synthase (N terminal domain)